MLRCQDLDKIIEEIKKHTDRNLFNWKSADIHWSPQVIEPTPTAKYIDAGYKPYYCFVEDWIYHNVSEELVRQITLRDDNGEDTDFSTSIEDLI